MGSNTCCQGLVESGFLIDSFSFLFHDATASGTILSLPQSPPPITFPALAETIQIDIYDF